MSDNNKKSFDAALAAMPEADKKRLALKILGLQNRSARFDENDVLYRLAEMVDPVETQRLCSQ